MRSSPPDRQQALALARRVGAKFNPVWSTRSQDEQVALSLYFLPHGSSKPVLAPTRPRVVKWYCPFASQSRFPSGHRYCINVYTGCAHGCVYCYAAGYEPERAAVKRGFERLLQKDTADLERFNVPPAPVHISNSTDCFQPLEIGMEHTRLTLAQVLAHRRRFSTVTVITKNPLLPVRRGYIDIFRELGRLPPDHPRFTEFKERSYPAFQVEVTLAFWQDSSRAVYDPRAPSVTERVEGIRALWEVGIPVALRVDPLFPRSPLPVNSPTSLADFGLCEAQTIEDLANLVAFAKEVGARHVVYSPLKIVKPRGRGFPEAMGAMRRVYEALAFPEKLVWRGGSWRLPKTVADAHVIRQFLKMCEGEGVKAKFCMQDLVEIP